MLIRTVHAEDHKWTLLFPNKRGLQPVGPPSLTLLGWFSPPTIDQYSSLLPPVGVWTVSQFQCGGPSSQNPYRSYIPCRETLLQGPCGPGRPSGVNLTFARLSPSTGQIGYALRTRAPVAIIGCKQPTCCPSTCMC